MHIGTYHVSRISPRPRRISYRRINVFGAAVSHVSRINVLAYSRIHVSTYHVLTYHVSAHHVLTSSRICVSRISMCLPLAIACLPIAMLWPGLAIARPRPWPQQWQWVCQWPCRCPWPWPWHGQDQTSLANSSFLSWCPGIQRPATPDFAPKVPDCRP